MWNNFIVEHSNFWLFQTFLEIYIEVLIAMCKHFLLKSTLVCSDADGPYTLAYESYSGGNSCLDKALFM